MMTEEERLAAIAKDAAKPEELIRAYQTIFNTEDGELVLWDLAQYGFLVSPTMVTNHTPDRRVWMNEGRREVILEILKFLNKDINDVKKMIADAYERGREHEM